MKIKNNDPSTTQIQEAAQLKISDADEKNRLADYKRLLDFENDKEFDQFCRNILNEIIKPEPPKEGIEEGIIRI